MHDPEDLEGTPPGADGRLSRRTLLRLGLLSLAATTSARSAGAQAAKPGAEVVLTLDADAQKSAIEVLEQEYGAAVAIDCRTGDIL